MLFNRKLTALSAAIVFSTLSACGGGGGGGGGSDNDNPPAPRQQLTTLPVFLQGNEANCNFIESGNNISSLLNPTVLDLDNALGGATSINCALMSGWNLH